MAEGKEARAVLGVRSWGSVMTELTPQQRNVLEFIKRFIADLEYPPTRKEIADGLGFKSCNAAEEHLQALDRKGAIRLHRGIARGLRVTDWPKQ